MDKELVRIAIIATGMFIMIGMIFSSYLKDKREREEELDFYDDEFEDELIQHDDVFEAAPVSSLKKTSDSTPNNVSLSKNIPPASNSSAADSEVEDAFFEETHAAEPPPRPAVTPSIIQFSVITKGEEDFNGADIFYALENLGLEYGSMKIFERIDENRFVHFGVVCMVEPGTFPDNNLANFYCPGVVFFMQMDGLEDPVSVFDDFVHTIVLFAQQMDGVVLDHRRHVLTHEMVEAIRRAL